MSVIFINCDNSNYQVIIRTLFDDMAFPVATSFTQLNGIEITFLGLRSKV